MTGSGMSFNDTGAVQGCIQSGLIRTQDHIKGHLWLHEELPQPVLNLTAQVTSINLRRSQFHVPGVHWQTYHR